MNVRLLWDVLMPDPDGFPPLYILWRFHCEWASLGGERAMAGFREVATYVGWKVSQISRSQWGRFSVGAHSLANMLPSPVELLATAYRDGSWHLLKGIRQMGGRNIMRTVWNLLGGILG